MTTIYFVRHAKPDYQNHNDRLRELTEKGLEDSRSVTAFLSDKKIDLILSSPYRRAIDTIKDFADKNEMPIFIVDDFRERKVDTAWIDDFESFCKSQWEDFNFKLPGGESLGEVQSRNIRALKKILQNYKGKNMVIGTHGTSLSTIIHYFDPAFGYEDFQKIKNLMPWILRFDFFANNFVSMREYRLCKNLWREICP